MMDATAMTPTNRRATGWRDHRAAVSEHGSNATELATDSTATLLPLAASNTRPRALSRNGEVRRLAAAVLNAQSGGPAGPSTDAEETAL
jgi:hypothetical protein